MGRLTLRLNEHLLVWVAVCFLTGGAIAVWMPVNLAPWCTVPRFLPVLAVSMVAAWLLPLGLRPIAPLPFFLVVGFLHTLAALQPPTDPNHVAVVIQEQARATITGRILSLPEFDGERTRFELAADTLLPHEGAAEPNPRPVRGTVQLSLRGRLSAEFIPGTVIMAIVILDRIRNYQTPGAFDYQRQMADKGILCSGWINSAEELLLVREAVPSGWMRARFLAERMRLRIANFLSQRFEPDTAGLYQALLIGTLAEISPNLLETFKENGCFHVLSVSGLHFSLLGLFAVSALTLLLKRSRWLLLHTHAPTLALALTAPVLLGYVCIAGLHVPAVRSLLTALLVLVAVVLRRQRSFTHLIAAAALLILACSPLALFTASFQLSFAAVLAINLIAPRLPLFIAEPGGGHITPLLRALQSLLYVSLAATAGTLPILLYHFNRVSLIGPVMNLFIEPLLCLWALPIGLIASPLIWIAPDLAAFAFTIGTVGIRLAVWMAETMAGFPLASLWTITPTFAEMALFFTILWLGCRQGNSIRQWLTIAGLTLGLLASFTAPLWLSSAKGQLTVSLLDVGQGASVFVRLPDGGTLLVDGGGRESSRFNIGQAVIAPFLWHQRLWRLDDLVVTHPHKDHYNGLPFVFHRFRPKRVLINGDTGDEPAYEEFLAMVRATGTPVQVAKTGDVLRQGDRYRLECLGMAGILDDDSAWSVNDRSLVLRLRHGERAILLPADIGVHCEDRLVQSTPSLLSDVLLAPHHGSITSTGQELLRAVRPAVLLVSVGRSSKGKQPAPEHVRNWRAKQLPFYTTADHGTTTIMTDGSSLRLATFNGEALVRPGEKTANNSAVLLDEPPCLRYNGKN